MTSKPPLTSSKRRAAIALFAAFMLFAVEIAALIHQAHGDSAYLYEQLPHIAIWLLCLVILSLVLRHTLYTQTQTIQTSILGFNHLPLPAIIVDQQGLIFTANQAASQFAKQSIASLSGQPVHDLFHPPQIDQKTCILCRQLKIGQALAASDFSFPDHHWQQISLTKLSDYSPALFLQLHSDITSHKQVKDQMALVFDGANLGYWDWDFVTGRHQVNRQWLDMLGLVEDDLQGYISDWHKRIHPDDRARTWEGIHEHIESDTPYAIEFRMRHRLGHWVWILGAGAVVERDSRTGEPTRLCGTHQNITARKQSESNLQATYQIISQSSSVVLKWHSTEGLPIEFATENVLQLLGYSVEQLVNDNLYYQNLIHPEDLPIFSQELVTCQHNPSCQEIDHLPYRIISRDGGIRWVQDHKVVARNDQGRVTGYQGLVTDITRQRQQSSAIRNIISGSHEKQYTSSVLDNLNVLTAETLAADYSLIGEILPHGKPRVLSFCALTKAMDNRVYTPHPQIISRLIEGKICCHSENVDKQFPGDTWLRERGIQGLVGIPLYNEKQQISGFVIALYRQIISDPQFLEDILKLFATQITAELERSSAIDELQIQKQRLIDAQSISHIGDWQWYWSENYFSWSDEMYRITGTQRINFMPSFAAILAQLVHPEDRDLFKTTLQNANGGDSIAFRHRIVMNNGETRHVYQRGKFIRDQQNRTIGIRGTMQDITERLKTEQRLLEAKQEAERAAEVKAKFLANMSHEIRTPMNAIIGLVELCLNSPIEPKQRDYLERVETAAQGLMSLINDILDFSKMESGKLNLDAVPFSLNNMLDQVFSTMEELCNRKQLALIRPHIDLQNLPLLGDPQRLKQILINLIGNAIKFTKRGKIEISIKEIERSDQQITLEFAISDTGIGISPEQQRKLFDAFTQGDNSVSRHYGGTGLGLVICKQLVEQMDGHISVTSQPGIGSRFEFSVKLGITDPDNLQPIQLNQHKELEPERFQHLANARILLVEDNEVNRLVASELLKLIQVQTDCVENGEVALTRLKQNQYDCVLMDVQMPGLDGYQTTRLLRQLAHCENLPVIAMTANVMTTDRDRCLKAGMNDFIGKPILPETLFATLAKWIKPDQIKHSPVNTSHSSEHASQGMPTLYGIDSSIGLLHTADDPKVYRKVLMKFAENHLHSLNEIKRAIAHKDWLSARQTTHTIKGLAGSLGAIQLQNHLTRLEEALNNPNIENTAIINRVLRLSDIEMNGILVSIRNSLTSAETESPAQPEKTYSAAETRQHLQTLLAKLEGFDSDADQQIELTISGINDSQLSWQLNQIKKQIANYRFVEAADALGKLLDSMEQS